MRVTKKLLKTVQSAFLNHTFEVANEFKWSPSKKRITYNLSDKQGFERLLHEVAHAELGHSSYDRDVELITLERDAWYHASTVIAPSFDLVISDQLIENDLDSYRDWLHARSTCPKCLSNGIQTGSAEYTCVQCREIWKVNRATGCALRRYTKKHA